MNEELGARFQRFTKYYPGVAPSRKISQTSPPEPFKTYTDVPVVQLPTPTTLSAPLQQLLKQRKSVRHYERKALTPEEVGTLLWAAGGVRSHEGNYYFRTAPSAGALYPLETYVAANRVEGIPAGIYHYRVREHLLEEINKGEKGADFAKACMGQDFLFQAPLVVAWTAVFARAEWKYGDRAYRYVYLDCGHVAQNLALAACAMGLGSCQVGALFDDKVNSLLGVDGEKESILYMSSVGAPGE